MNITNKKFIVKTQDKFGEKTFEIVEGTYETNELDNYRKYSYLSKFGHCEITFIKNNLTILRRGIFNNVFEISFEGKNNKFIYEMDLLKEEFYSSGSQFYFDNVKKIFSFSYRLLDLNYSEINEITISIKEI